MPWSKNKTVPALEDKSDADKELFARVANAQLDKGKSEKDAIIAGMVAVKNSCRVQKAAIPAHLQGILNRIQEVTDEETSLYVQKAVLGANSLPVGIDRNLVKVELNKRNELVFTFDTKETIVTKPIELGITQIESVVNAHGGYPAIPRFDGFVLNTDPLQIPESNEEGMVTWNPVERTLDVNLGSGVILQGGQESHVNVANYTGSALLNARVVAFAGTDITHDLPKATYMLGDGNTRPANVIGLTTEEIPDSGNHGRVTAFGKVRGIDTTGATYGEVWNEGDFLFVHPTIPGGLTKFEPAPPYVSVFVGIVLAKDATDGSIFVKPALTAKINYGAFSSSVTQVAPAINTPRAITCNSTEIASGVSIVSGSKFTVARSGLYRMSFSLQVNKPSSGDDSMWVWLRKNGADVVNSSTRLLIQGNNSYLVAAWDFIQNLSAGDYLELMHAVADTAIELQALPVTGFSPASPSVLIHITQVNQ